VVVLISISEQRPRMVLLAYPAMCAVTKVTVAAGRASKENDRMSSAYRAIVNFSTPNQAYGTRQATTQFPSQFFVDQIVILNLCSCAGASTMLGMESARAWRGSTSWRLLS
jgi:hypothetical protein